MQRHFFRARAQDQNLFAWGYRLCDLLKEVRVFLHPTVTNGIGLVVEMRRRTVGMDDSRRNSREPHRKNLGRQMIDPNDGSTMGLTWLHLCCAAHVSSSLLSANDLLALDKPYRPNSCTGRR
jgi:hypothetical protein